jgi:hypothetical protein
VNLAKHQNLNQVIVKKQLEKEHKTGEWDQSSRYDSGTLDPLINAQIQNFDFQTIKA